MSFAPITDGQRKSVEKDIKFDLAQYQNKMKLIMEWMKKQPHLPKIPEENADKLIRAFLYGSKLNSEVVKTKLDTYFAMRHQIPDLLSNRDPTSQDIRDSVDRIRYFPLSEMTPEGIRVTVTSYHPEKEMRFSNKDFTNYVKRGLATADVRMMILDELEGGEIYVFDCRGFCLSHLAEVPWPLALKATSYILAGFPLRVKGVYLINAPSYMETTLNIMKPVIKQKIRKRIQTFQGDHTSLYKYIPRRILPSDYGGEAPSIEASSRAWQTTLEAHRDFLTQEAAQMTDESLRPKDSHNDSGQRFGVSGSFCKLNID